MSVRVSRRVRIILLVAIPALALVALIGSFIPFIRPATAELPAHADAVVVLSGDHGERIALATPLLESGVTRVLVFAGTPDGTVEDQLCRGGQAPYEALCLRPDPDSTRTEARAAAELARARGWKHLIVVTSTQHVTRTRILFRRCFDGEVSVIGGKPPYGRSEIGRQVAREWLRTAHALTVSRGC